MDLLVCGGAGFIGSNFIRLMLSQNIDVNIINYDKLTYAGNLDNLKDIENNPRYKFVQGDITDMAGVLQIIKDDNVDYIINFAAETHVDRSIHNGSREFVLANTLGVQTLLEACRLHNIKKMVQVSTDEVYGSLRLDDEFVFTENSLLSPNSPYAAAKAGGDLLCRAYFKTHNTPVIVTHCSNNYGPYQFPEKLIPFFVFKLMKGEKVPVYGDGKNVRDWIHVEDHCRALALVLEVGVTGEVYNIGADNELNNLDLTQMILEIMGKGEELLEYVSDRPGHDRRYGIDASRMKKLGWNLLYPKEKFKDGLKETIAWYQKNTDWVEKIWQKKREEMNKFQENLINK